MGRLLRISVLAAVLVGVTVVVPLAGANGPMGGTENTTLNMPADGSGEVTRSPMPASSTTGTVGVTAASNDNGFINSLTQVLTSLPTRKARVLGCLAMNSFVADTFGHSENFEVDADTLQLVFLAACLQLVVSLKTQAAAHGYLPLVALARCSQQPVSVPIHVTKTATGYKLTVSGTTSKPKKMAFRASGKKTATSLKTTIKPTARNGKLANAIGPSLGVGFLSGSGSSAKLKISLGVR